MSDQQINEQKPKCKLAAIALILSLLMSIAALTMSIVNYRTISQAQGSNKKVVISKQYDKGKSVEKAKATQKPMVVFFYTDWCGYCQRFAPIFDKISKDSKIKKNVAVAYVNCENPQNSAIIEEYGIQGFPTVYVIDKSGRKTHLDNNLFFSDDTKKLVTEEILKLIEE